MGGFMILGGALKGAGAGLAEGNKSRRQEQLEKLAQDRADARSERDMQFRSTEAAVARSAQVDENKRQEGVAAANVKPEYVTADDGGTLAVRGNTAVPVTTPEGKTIKLLPKASDSTEEIKNAEYMLSHGIAKNANEAWTKANRLKDKDPGVIRDTIYRDWIRTLGANESDANVIEEQANKKADEYMAKNYPDEAGVDPNAVPNDPVHIEGATPPGMGTDKNPYRADTQNHVDWFKKFAKPGTSMVIDGTLYKK